MSSDEDCVAFDKNVTFLNKYIHSLVVNPSVPGCALNLSKQLKFYPLFDGEVSESLWTWRTLGRVDEQNIEDVRPQFNQLIRRFGNTRGRRRAKLVMEAFLYSRSTWVRETVDEILENTKRKKVRGNIKPRKRCKQDNPPADRGDGGVDCERRDPSQHTGGGDAEGAANEEGVEQAKDGGTSAPGRAATERRKGRLLKHPSMDVPTSMDIKKSTRKLSCVEHAKNTRLCNANPLPRGLQRPSCGGGRGGPGGLGGAKASMPLMERGDDSGTAARRGDGDDE